MHTHCTRRRFLQAGSRIGGTVLAAAALAGPLILLPEDGWSADERVDWRRVFSSPPSGGFGTVKELTGSAFANQRSLARGDRVESGEQLRVARNGSLVVSLSDKSIIGLRGGTVMDFQAGTQNEGAFNLVIGAVLAVFPKNHRFLLAGPTATIGIKGTVVYRQAFEESVHTARAMEGRTATIPSGLSDYFCTCNGAVEFLSKQDQSVVGSDAAEHHSSGFFVPGATPRFNKFEMINHFDRDIKALVDRQEGEKHDTSFLKL